MSAAQETVNPADVLIRPGDFAGPVDAVGVGGKRYLEGGKGPVGSTEEAMNASVREIRSGSFARRIDARWNSSARNIVGCSRNIECGDFAVVIAQEAVNSVRVLWR